MQIEVERYEIYRQHFTLYLIQSECVVSTHTETTEFSDKAKNIFWKSRHESKVHIWVSQDNM